MDDVLLAKRFAALEAQVKLLSDQAGLSCPPFPGAVGVADGQPSPSTSQIPDEIIALARAGKTSQAISAYRRLTGVTLLEAKRTVEDL